MQKRHDWSVTCRELLALPLLSQSVLLAGDKGLDKPVRRINVMEVPDVTDWVQVGEFLMTTGYPFRDQPNAFVDLIRNLSAKGVVALGIKTKRFLKEIPQEVIALADELHVPLIELPPQTIFSEVIHEVMELVIDSELRQLGVLQERMQAITGVLLEGGEVMQLLDCLEQQTGHFVLFIDSLYGVSGAGLRRLYSSEEQWKQMAEAITAVPWASGVQPSVLPNLSGACYVAQADLPKGRHCTLILLSEQEDISELDRLTIDRTLPLIELEVMNLEARVAVEFKYKDQFVQDWLFGRLESLADVRIRAEVCGFSLDESARYAVLLISYEAADLQAALQKIRNHLKNWTHHQVYATYFDRYVLLLVTLPKGVSSQSLRDLAKFLHTPERYICIGKTVPPDRVNESLLEAIKIEEISHAAKLEPHILRYEDLGIFPLLTVLPDSLEVRRFREKFVQPLIEFERTHNLNVIETLDAYFKCNQNMKLTASALFTHYNTIVYRLDRIETILGMDLSKSETQIHLYLALKFLQLEKSRGTSYGT